MYEDLQKQSHTDWSWILCSNGFSKLFSDFVENKRKFDQEKRLTYVSSSYVELADNSYSVIANIGKRRKDCIKKLDSDYIFMFDADAKILDRRMFEVINRELTLKPKKLCIYYIKHKTGKTPVFPIIDGRLDLLNFCVSIDLAKKIGYPSSVDYFRPANDFRFFVKAYEASKGSVILLDNLFCEYNGNNRYRSARDIVVKMQKTKYSTTKQYVAYSLKHYPFGLLKAIRDFPFMRNIMPYEIVFARNEYFKAQTI